jgi:hypothetical protein
MGRGDHPGRRSAICSDYCRHMWTGLAGLQMISSAASARLGEHVPLLIGCTAVHTPMNRLVFVVWSTWTLEEATLIGSVLGLVLSFGK